jgi:hypothetical protein
VEQQASPMRAPPAATPVVVPVIQPVNAPPKLNAPPPGVTMGANPDLETLAQQVVETERRVGAMIRDSEEARRQRDEVQQELDGAFAEEMRPVEQPKFYQPSQRTSKYSFYYQPPAATHPMLSVRRIHGTVAEGLPESVDLKKICPPVSDRKYVGAGDASAAFVEVLWHALTERALPGRLSASFIEAACDVDYDKDCGESGVSLADEILVLVKRGVCSEDFYPILSGETDFIRASVAAAPFRLHDPVQVDFANPNAVKAALASNRPVIISFAVHESFEEPGEGGLLALPADDEPLMGGHAALVVGYNARGWLIRNSWGEDWGDGGYAVMPYGYEKHWFEAWTATSG